MRISILQSSSRRISSGSDFGFRISDFNEGFTLIELILAVGVMAIVLISVNAVFFAAMRLHDATTNAVDDSLPGLQALATMRRDLQGAMPPTASGIMSGDFKVGGVVSTGQGLPVDIEMSTTTGVMRDNEPWGDVQRVTYELKAPGDANAPGRDLIRSVTRNILATTTVQAADEWMLGNVQSVQYECFDGSAWQNSWDSTVTTNLPTAVRVKIFLAGAGSSAPLEMVVPLDSQSRTNTTDVSGG